MNRLQILKAAAFEREFVKLHDEMVDIANAVLTQHFPLENANESEVLKVYEAMSDLIDKLTEHVAINFERDNA